jgi:hypothetical protein
MFFRLPKIETQRNKSTRNIQLRGSIEHCARPFVSAVGASALERPQFCYQVENRTRSVDSGFVLFHSTPKN